MLLAAIKHRGKAGTYQTKGLNFKLSQTIDYKAKVMNFKASLNTATLF